MSDHDRDRDDLVADVVDGLTLNQEVEWDRCERLATPANRPALENLRALSGVLAGGRPGAGDAWPSWAATWRGIVCRSRTPGPVEPLRRARLGREVSIVSLADYVSMEDEVRFDDVAEAMDVAWRRHGLPRGKGVVDAIVHSTGGLVIRDWLQRHCTPARAPVKHLVMLAPANFGSHLAHKGRSFIGRVYKGFVAKKPEGRAFETGTHIL